MEYPRRMIKLFAPRMVAFMDANQFKVDITLAAGPNFTVIPDFSYQTLVDENAKVGTHEPLASHQVDLAIDLDRGLQRHQLHVVPCSGWRDAPGNPIFHGDILSPPNVDHRHASPTSRAYPTLVCIITQQGYQSLENAIVPGQNILTSVISHGYRVTGNAFLNPTLVHADQRHYFVYPFTKPE